MTPLTTSAIFGLKAEPYADTIAAYFCNECDVRSWFRWSGRAYELGLFATADTVALGDDHASGADLFGRPTRSAVRRSHIQPCAQARVHDVAGRAGARWYFVETTALPRTRGWVEARSVIAPDDCS